MGVPGSSDRLAVILKRIYRVLLVVYPREYRREYGSKMVQVFGDQCREEQQKSGLVGLGQEHLREAKAAALLGAEEQ